jgi:hypothetical protein
MLLDFLGPHLKVNDRNSFVDGIKHIDSPNHPVLRRYKVKKAIYLVSDPRETVLSLFRRNYAMNMLTKLRTQHSTPQEYSQALEASKPEIESLAEFLSNGKDLFGFEQHWRNWQTAGLRFPVMFVRFEALHRSFDRILEYLELPEELEKSFPAWRPRASKLDSLTERENEQLDRIYRSLAEQIIDGPDFFIRYPAGI